MNLEMEAAGQGRPWGKLVKVDSGETEVLLVKRECTVGRRKGCDLSFPANKLVSGEHCKIVQDESSGMVWLEDMSTNGTVINMSKLVKKQVHMLQNGDIIYFVYRKNEPEQNVAYVYHSINPELGVCQDVCGAGSGGVDVVGEGPPLSVEPVLLRSAPRELSPEEPQPSTSTSASHLHAEGRDAGATSPAQGPSKAPVTTQGKERRDGVEPERKKRKTDNDKDHDLDQPHTSNTSARGVLRGLLGKAPVEETKTDKMEESLTCIICQDLLHDCVSLQPCMHTFCAACYSGWMERSSLCPTCRCPVERIRKNHILNNLVEAYLLQHPEKCRSEEDLRGMDGRNKITQDMLQPKVDRSLSDEDGSSDYLFEFSDNDSDGSDIGQPFVMCRQCPGYRREVGQMLFATGSSYWVTPPPAAPLPPAVPLVATQVPAVPAGAEHGEECRKSAVEQPSTSADLCPPTDVVQYRCPPHGSHVICTCCLQPMPDRRSAPGGQQVAAQQCGACQRPFCHLYWGCQRLGCQGCLARFNELNLTDKCLDGVLNNNSYESEILQDYLTSRGKTWRDVLQQGLQTLQQGAYHLSDYRIAANTVLCYCCGLRAFKELAYQFRQSIPASELPAAVMSRPDCYWGRNCRTQVKAHHAVKFNHICEQTRFKS